MNEKPMIRMSWVVRGGRTVGVGIEALTRNFIITKEDLDRPDAREFCNHIHRMALAYYRELLTDKEVTWVTLGWNSYA